MRASLKKFETTSDIDDGFQQGKQQLEFHVTPEGAALGLTSAEIGRQVRSAYYGAEALRQQRGRDEVKIMVRLPENERNNEYYLNSLLIMSPSGVEIPLLEAATPIRGRSYSTISRRDQRRTINVTADVNPPSQAGIVISTMEKEILPALIKKYPGLTYGYEGKQADMNESLQALIRGLLVALLGIYVLLAIPFKSYLQPLIVMVSIPFGIVGAVLGHLIMGYSLSILSVMGIIALAGVVVNDSLVLIDYANRLRLEGEGLRAAICNAGVRRFRPILLTTLTTFGGLAPMIFETSRQARFMIPMAISLGFGILFATLITLVLVPSLYVVVDDCKKILAK